MGDWGIGDAPLRREDARFLTGRGRYVADIDVPGQLVCVFLRSPHAHARILGIDSRVAAAMPGVVAVLDGRAMAADGIAPMRALWLVKGVDGPAFEPPRFGLARDTVHHVGEAVALIVAEGRAQAEDAAEAIAVEYETLPAVTTARAALNPGAPQLHAGAPGNLAYRFVRGDAERTEAAFAHAAHVTRIELINQRLAGCAMEPRAVLAHTEPDGSLVLHTSTQVPHHIRRLVAEQLGLAEAHVRVIAPDVGGGFGYKGKYTAEEAVLAWAARRLQRPLKWVASRSESFLSDLQGRDHTTTAELALDADGLFTGLRVHTLVNLGAYASTMGTATSSAVYSGLLAGMYRTPVLHAEVRGVFTNTLPTDAYRGAGRPEACYVLETIIDAAAAELGIDRAELRRRNLIAHAALPFTTCAGPTYDCGDFHRVFERALMLGDYAGFEARRRTNRPHSRRGIGIACYVESSGVGPSAFARNGGARVGLAETAEVRALASGRIIATLGTQNHGQGHETVFTQILVRELGIEPGQIEIVEGDTGKIDQGTGTFGSRSVAVGGSALVLAARKLKEQGWYPGSTAQTVWHARAEFDPSSFAFSNGVHVCEIEVTCDTGEITVARYSAVDDVGTVIHPVIVEGQLHGGVAQGLGQALLEACLYASDSGQLLSGSLQDYALPRAHHMPRQLAIENDETQPFPHNPLGAKGAGEAGAIAAPAALVLAVQDALRPLGVTLPDMPLTPAKVWAALRAAQGR